MIYTTTITAAKGGSSSSPSVQDFPVTEGLIYQFELYFPPGSSGLLKVKIRDGGYSVWPSEPDEWFFGDNHPISFPDRYFISSPDHLFQVWYYNEDDTYDHKFQVRIGQVSAAIFIASFLPSQTFEPIADILKQLGAAQESEQQRRDEILGEYFGTVPREPLPSEE